MNLNDVPQRIRWITIAGLVVIAVLLTILDATGNLDTALRLLRDPVTVVAEWTNGRVDPLADSLAGPRSIAEAQAQIDALQSRLAELERENEELREIQGEYQILLDLFNRARQSPEITRITANVIGQDTSPIIRSIVIDKGTADGVNIGMPVESARGLVGQVFRVSTNSAQIILITDSASSVPARLGSSRATGILRGGGLGGTMTIDWIDLQYQIEEGEVVLSSGLSSKFPEDVVIGRISEVDRREADLFQRAVVQSAVDFDALEIVFVITDFQPAEVDFFQDSIPGELP